MTTPSVDLSTRTSTSKGTVGRSVSINGVHALDVTIKKQSNLDDPVLDINLKLNNPLGRLWRAIMKLWQNQSTVVALKFTIPLLVLPVVLFVGWRIWQGRGVNQPMSKLGIVHEIEISGVPQDILVLPTSDVYLLDYAGNFLPSSRLTEKPVIVIGTYHNLTNTLTVTQMLAYNQVDIPISTPNGSVKPTMWQNILKFIDQFR